MHACSKLICFIYTKYLQLHICLHSIYFKDSFPCIWGFKVAWVWVLRWAWSWECGTHTSPGACLQSLCFSWWDVTHISCVHMRTHFQSFSQVSRKHLLCSLPSESILSQGCIRRWKRDPTFLPRVMSCPAFTSCPALQGSDSAFPPAAGTRCFPRGSSRLQD